MTMNPTAKKLGLKPSMRALVINAPHGYLKLLAPLPEGVVMSETLGGSHEFVQFFANLKSDIEKTVAKLLKSASPGALVWITYPKKTSGVKSDLSREAVWAAMEGSGWRPVSQIAIDEVWSALRFRPTADVKSRKSRSPNYENSQS
jgi:predicted SnoaL-like aldol condensation-catalyzing enzyme